MNRSSIRKSFLDDLLGENEPSAPAFTGTTAAAAVTTTTADARQQKTKSVRFLEEGDDSNDILGALIPNPMSAASSSIRDAGVSVPGSRGSSLTPASLSSGSQDPPKRQELPRTPISTSSGNSSDWLGLSDERPKSDSNRNRERGKSDTWLEEDDFSGKIPASRSRTPVDEGVNVMPGSSSMKMQNDARGRVIDHRSQPHMDANREEDAGTRTTTGDPVRRLSIPTVPDATASSAFSSMLPNSRTLQTSTESVQLLLQTQVKVLEIEKTHLSQMLDQCRLLHGQEIELMNDMHQKQLEMTKSFLLSQEKMSLEEKERRINFLTEELDSLESDRKHERDGYRSKLENLMQERDQEMERMRERHQHMLTRLTQDHETEMQWSQRKWQQEADQVKSLSQVHGSIQDLVSQWKASADQMHELQNIVTTNQQRMINEASVDVADREKTVSALLQKLDSFVVLRSQLSELTEEQKDLLIRERSELRRERNDWLRDQKKRQEDLEEERHEIRIQRESLNQEISKLHEQKLQVQRDQESVTREGQEIERQRLHVKQQQSQLSDLEARSHNLATSEILLHQDKSKLLDLAQQVMRRAEELETLTDMAARERDDGLAARTRSESLLRDVERKSAVVQEKLETVEEKERLLKDQIRFLESERQAVKEMKDRILCSLCNSSIQSYGRLTHQPPPPLDETPLVIWQMTGQRESALLAQEAQFLDQLRSGHKGSYE